MGIKDLSKVIAEHAANGMKTNEMKAYFGRKVAIDASMSLYQFLIAIRQDGGVQLLNQEGETTSHLNGMFYRTIRMMENGLKPAFVFDGKPPVLKAAELDKRTDRREENKKALEEAKERGDDAAVEKFQRRLVKVSREHSEDCKRLLLAMGVPVVDAPCEAEAQCAELVRAGKVYAAGTEDMDALTFGSKILLRHLTFSEAKKMPIKEYFFEKILSELGMGKEQFVDLCILLGCDYCPNIKGIGPKKAVDLIKKHKNIEGVLENIDQTKYPIPEGWLYKEARELFINPEVTNGDEIELNWKEPDIDGVVKILVSENGFSEDRVRSALERLVKSRQVVTQGRIDTFFKTTGSATATEPSAAKRQKLDAKTKGKQPATKSKSGKVTKASSAKKK